MSSFIEQRFITYVSSTLDRFKWTIPNTVANFRCNICGDSQKNAHKARGYFYLVKQSDMFCFRCQNCGASMSFRKYIKDYFPHYYNEYRLEIFAWRRSSSGEVTHKPVDTIVSAPKVDLKASATLLTPLSELPDDHIAVKYCLDRMIPRSRFDTLYYTKNYRSWIQTYLPDTIKKYPGDERLVMLMKDKDGNVFGAQGRTLANASIRYITVKFDENKPKVFGLESLNTSLPIFVLEGIIDSLYVPNAIAICGGDVGMSLKEVGVDYSKFIVVLDNEARSKDTIRRMEHAVALGCNVCVWPIDSSLKDVNEMIRNGYTRQELLSIISNNIFKGAKALAKIKHWKKV